MLGIVLDVDIVRGKTVRKQIPLDIVNGRSILDVVSV